MVTKAGSRWKADDKSMWAERKWSGKRSGRDENWVSGSGEVSGRVRK